MSLSALAAPAASAGLVSGVVGVGDAGITGAAGVDENLRLMERMPWRWLRWWPFWVSPDSGKCWLTFLTVMSGQVRKLPLRMAASQAALVEKPMAPWRYLTARAMLGSS